MPSKPAILACACPLAGHLGPILKVSKALQTRGFEITVLTGNVFKEKVLEAGFEFVPLEGRADFHEYMLHKLAPGLLTMPPGLEQTGYSIKEIFVKSMPEQYDAVQTALKALEAGGKPVVVIAETMFFGTHPLKLGAPGVKPAGVITLGTIPCMLPSERAPGVPSRPPQMTEKINEAVFLPGTLEHRELLKTIGADQESLFLLNHIYASPDRFLQLCPPSLEFNLTDPPPGFVFAGNLPHTTAEQSKDELFAHKHLPEWWPDLKAGKKVIVVSQGTAAINYKDLLAPSLKALANRDDLLVVGILGVRGAKLPEDVETPKNARISDYLSYDDILPHADLFIFNGGYGGLQHSLSHGVPVIIGGGDLVDKPATAARATWAGVCYDLETASATPELVQKAVETVLTTPTYYERAKMIQKELEEYNSANVLEKHVLELAA